MRQPYRNIRRNQLDKTLGSFPVLERPRRGWIRAIRETTGLTLRELGRTIGVTPQTIAALERSEERDTITLQALRSCAEAMDCELVYALVPKGGRLTDAAETRERDKARTRVLAVERSMALEGQAVGGVDEKIEKETKRALRGRRP